MIVPTELFDAMFDEPSSGSIAIEYQSITSSSL